MAQPRAHMKVKLIIGMLSRFPELLDRAGKLLEKDFGPVSHRSEIIPFNFSDYYESEMGAGLLRSFLAFERLVDAGTLAAIKLRTNSIEQELAGPQWPVARPINVDPGYLDLSKLILASAKDYAHRIYLGQGIYAEVTLTFKDGALRSMPWTYPDYRSEAYLHFFEKVRADFHRAVRVVTDST